MRKRIYYHDTDCGGVVYHGNYLKFLEEARTEYLEERGLSMKDLLDRGIGFVVKRQDMDYKSPAYYGDTLEIETRVKEHTAYRIIFVYNIKNQDGKLVGTASTDIVCVGRDLKIMEIPPIIKAQLAPSSK